MTVNRGRAAVWLWMLFAFVVWNVVFDRVIINAGREYLDVATAASQGSGSYARIDDTMRPARSRAFWWATSSAMAILIAGTAAARRASRAA